MENKDKIFLHGVVKEDPALNATIGTQIDFKAIAMNFQTISSVGIISDWKSFEGILLSLHFRKPDTHSVEGSAIMVAPGIAFCATHVIKPHINRIMAGQTSTVALAIAKDGFQTWQIRKVTLVENTDLTVLGLEFASDMPSDNLFRFASISTRLPKIGETLYIAGFRASEKSFDLTFNAEEKPQINYSGDILICTGKVTQQFATGRDSCMLPAPCLEVDCPSYGGMSGGPVFDSHGNLIGILASSYNYENSSGEPPSFVSLLWHGLAVEFEGGWPAPAFRGKNSLLNLPNACLIDKPSAVFQKETPEGLKLFYEKWE